jgi:hypothetical protein
MIGPFRSRFRARKDGRIDFHIAEEERDLVRGLVEQMRELLMSTVATGDVDPNLRRLYPTAYPDDPALDSEYQQLVRDQLLEQRLEHLDEVEATLDREQLSEAEAIAWLTVLNDVRLVLGTNLDVSEDDDFSDLDPSDPDHHSHAVYQYLGYLLEEFVRALSP